MAAKSIEATVTSKGQVTVPAALRKALRLKAGDKLVFTQDERGRFIVDARTETLADLRGIVGDEQVGPIDGDQVNRWIAESRAARWLRSRSPDEGGSG